MKVFFFFLTVTRRIALGTSDPPRSPQPVSSWVWNFPIFLVSQIRVLKPGIVPLDHGAMERVRGKFVAVRGGVQLGGVASTCAWLEVDASGLPSPPTPLTPPPLFGAPPPFGVVPEAPKCHARKVFSACVSPSHRRVGLVLFVSPRD